MPKARATELFIYSVKGMRGVPQDTLGIHRQCGVLGDRISGYLRTPPSTHRGWLPKNNFYVGMNTPRMVSLAPEPADTRTYRVQQALGLKDPPPEYPAGGSDHITDTKGPTVSLLNLATFRLFESWLRAKGHLSPETPLNPARFRMNVHIEGWEPFAELDVAQHPETLTLIIGRRHFKPLSDCVRCRAIHANPQTGEEDLELLTKLLVAFMAEHRPGYRGNKAAVMGILLTPLDVGALNRNDALSIA